MLMLMFTFVMIEERNGPEEKDLPVYIYTVFGRKL